MCFIFYCILVKKTNQNKKIAGPAVRNRFEKNGSLREQMNDIRLSPGRNSPKPVHYPGNFLGQVAPVNVFCVGAYQAFREKSVRQRPCSQSRLACIMHQNHNRSDYSHQLSLLGLQFFQQLLFRFEDVFALEGYLQITIFDFPSQFFL